MDEDKPTQAALFYRFGALMCVSIMFFLLGCHAGAPSLPTPAAGIEAPDRHVVSSAALRRIMQRLETITYDRVQADLALDATRIEEAEKLAAAASELASVAGSISPAAVNGTLDEAARRRFDSYARELAREAATLRELAAERQFLQSAAQFQRMGHACAGCHSLYRAR